MSTMGYREQAEREVLATLLLDPSAFGKLPEGFNIDAFELPEYQKLFGIIKDDMIRLEGNLAGEAIKIRYPEMESVILNVLFAAIPLNGRFRSCAGELMSHYPFQRQSEPDVCRQNQERHPTHAPFSFKVLSGKDIVSMDIPEQQFLVEGLITAESINFLAGEEGCGKSLLAMNLAISVANGTLQWLCFDIPQSCKVLYLNNELCYNDFARRFQKMCASLPIHGDMSQFFAPETVPPLTECWDSLNSLCADIHPGLVVLDCLYFSHSRKENDSSDMKALMRQFIDLRDSYHTAIMIVHHTRKKGAQPERMHDDQMRGSGVFGGIADTVLQIRRSENDETKRLLKPTKFRHVSDVNRKCRLLSLNADNLWFKDEGEVKEEEHFSNSSPNHTAREQIDFSVLFSGKQKMTFNEIVEACEPFGFSERTVQRRLNEAISRRIMLKPEHGKYQLVQLDIQSTDTG